MTYTRMECPECGLAVRPRLAWLSFENELHIGCPNCGAEWRFILAEQLKGAVPESQRPVHDWGVDEMSE